MAGGVIGGIFKFWRDPTTVRGAGHGRPAPGEGWGRGRGMEAREGGTVLGVGSYGEGE